MSWQPPIEDFLLKIPAWKRLIVEECKIGECCEFEQRSDAIIFCKANMGIDMILDINRWHVCGAVALEQIRMQESRAVQWRCIELFLEKSAQHEESVGISKQLTAT